MDEKRVISLSQDIKLLKAIRFYKEGELTTSFHTGRSNNHQESIIILYEAKDGASDEFKDELNAAIKPVLEKWIKKYEDEIKKEVLK